MLKHRNEMTSLNLFDKTYITDSLVPKVRSELIPSPPTYNTKYGYLSWESYSNISYYTRLLPPVPEDCPLPMGTKGRNHAGIHRQHCFLANDVHSLFFCLCRQIRSS